MNFRCEQQLNFSNLSPQKSQRLQASIRLVLNLQRLFGYMILSAKKYACPRLVLENIVDNEGK